MSTKSAMVRRGETRWRDPKWQGRLTQWMASLFVVLYSEDQTALMRLIGQCPSRPRKPHAR